MSGKLYFFKKQFTFLDIQYYNIFLSPIQNLLSVGGFDVGEYCYFLQKIPKIVGDSGTLWDICVSINYLVGDAINSLISLKTSSR